MNRLVNLALGLFGVYSGGKALASGLGLVDEDAPGPALPGGRVHAPPSAGRLRGRAAAGRGKDEIRVEVHDVKNLDQRVGYIVKMLQKSRTDGTVRKLAMKILTRQVNGKWAVPEKDWTAEVVAIFTYCQKNLRYVRDPHGIDLFSHAKRTIEWKGGDCDDKGAITLGALLLAAGYPIRLRVIQTVDSPDWNHIYLLVLLPPGGGPESRWVPLDATVQRPAGWEAPKRYIKRIRDFRVV